MAGAHTVVENMRHGMSPREACLDALKRVSRNYGDDMERLQAIRLRFYALRKDGEYGGASLWSHRNRNDESSRTRFAVNDGGKSRHEDLAYLYERSA